MEHRSREIGFTDDASSAIGKLQLADEQMALQSLVRTLRFEFSCKCNELVEKIGSKSCCMLTFDASGNCEERPVAIRIRVECGAAPELRLPPFRLELQTAYIAGFIDFFISMFSEDDSERRSRQNYVMLQVQNAWDDMIKGVSRQILVGCSEVFDSMEQSLADAETQIEQQERESPGATADRAAVVMKSRILRPVLVDSMIAALSKDGDMQRLRSVANGTRL